MTLVTNHFGPYSRFRGFGVQGWICDLGFGSDFGVRGAGIKG